MPAGVAPAGSETGELGSSVRFPPFTAKAPTAPTSALVHVQRPTVVAQAGVNGADAPGVADRRAAEERQGPVGRDGVTGDLTRSGVHREQELAVVGDLDPTRRRLVVRERTRPNRRQ